MKADHWLNISSHIRTLIDQHDEELADGEDDLDAGDEAVETEHFKIGAREKPVSFLKLEEDHRRDQAFTNFRTRLNTFLTGIFTTAKIPLPNDRPIHLKAGEMVCSIFAQ